MCMIQIRFTSRDEHRKALGWLPGRFSFKSWPDGRMMVPDEAVSCLAVEGISFVLKGNRHPLRRRADGLRLTAVQIPHLLPCSPDPLLCFSPAHLLYFSPTSPA